jgi:hypothetical protein
VNEEFENGHLQLFSLAFNPQKMKETEEDRLRAPRKKPDSNFIGTSGRQPTHLVNISVASGVFKFPRGMFPELFDNLVPVRWDAMPWFHQCK